MPLFPDEPGTNKNPLIMKEMLVEWPFALTVHMIDKFGEPYFVHHSSFRLDDRAFNRVRIIAPFEMFYPFGLAVGAWIVRNEPEKKSI